MRRFAIGVAAVLISLWLPHGAAAIAQTPERVPAATPPAAPAPSEPPSVPSCGDCHEQAAAFGTNPHAHGKGSPRAVVPNSICESCHGSGAAHIEGGGDKALIYRPAGPAGANKVCLGCHEVTTERISRHGGAHANSATVNCLTCHSIHSAEPHSAHLLATSELALCEGCHQSQVASFRNRPYAHRIGRGGMECTSCHEPHGRPGRDMLRRTSSGDRLPCYGCHSEKRGPFVFPHDAAEIGDCITCHDPHGASNPKMLRRATVQQLCIECHSPTTGNILGSQPPSFHNLSTPRYQNCTVCHTAIHGSNRDPQLMK